MITYQLGQFAPDRSVFAPGILMQANNVIPTADGYEPLPSISTISQALPSECRGACYTRTSGGSIRIVAGTATGLYELNSSDFSWTDITGTDGPYNLGADDHWTFTRFGDDLLIHNINDPIQKYGIEAGGTVTTLAGSPPKAKYSWVSGGFFILGYVDDGAATGPRTVQWCGVEDPTFWTDGERMSGSQVLPEGNEIVGGFGEQGGFTVIQRDGMQGFSFNPASGFTFTRSILNPKQGCAAPRSLVSIGPGMFFYLSEDGFFGGIERKPIGAQVVDRWFAGLAGGNLDTVQGAADPFRKMIWWRYQANDGNFYRLGYNWQLDRWVQSDVPVGELVAMATPNITWDGLSTLYATIDDVTEPFDSRLFIGGRPTMAAFTTDNTLGYFSGDNLEATFETTDVMLDEAKRTFINEARVVTDAQTFTLSDGVTPYHGGEITWSDPVSPFSRTKLCHFRQDGRLHRLKLVIPANTVWSTASSIGLNAQVTGST